MIDRIILHNFQKHGELEVILSPTITTLVGETESGKTTVIRALAWLATNTPSGQSFIKHGEEACKVSIYVSGHRIIRARSHGKNIYKLDGRVFKAFGQKVPDEISDILNISSLNFQGQMDPPFWFSLTAGQVSRELNSIINLEIIDQTTTNIISDVRKARTVVEISEARLRKAREEVSRLAFAKQMDTELKVIEYTNKQLAKKSRRIDCAGRSIERVSQLQRKVDRLSCAMPQAAKGISRLDRLLGSINRTTERIISLESMIGTVVKEKERWERLDTQQGELKIQLDKMKTCPLCGTTMKTK